MSTFQCRLAEGNRVRDAALAQRPPKVSRHVKESIERSLRNEALDARHFSQPSTDEIAPRLKLAPHSLDALLISLDRCQCRVLADAARTPCLLALDVAHRLNYLDRSECPAHAPAGHSVGLARAADGDRALRQSRTKRGEASRMRVAKYQPFINLVADDRQIFLQHHIGDCFQLLT